MECQASDSKKLYKVYDGSKRNRTRKKEHDETVASDESNSVCQVDPGRMSGRTSLQELPTAQALDGLPDGDSILRDRKSTHSMLRSPHEGHRASRSPRRQRRSTRECLSLALKAGMASTPRSISPPQDGDGGAQTSPQDDSLIYAYLEEAIKRDKKKHRPSHSRRHGDRRASRDRDASRSRDQRASRDRDASGSRDQRHRHRRRHEDSREIKKHVKEESPKPVIDQTVLLETFAKLCSQMNEKTKQNYKDNVGRTQSHKSLQCEVTSRRNIPEERHPVQHRSPEMYREEPSRIRSQDHFHKQHSREKITLSCYEKEAPKYASRMDVSRMRLEDSHREYHPPPVAVPTRTFIAQYRDRPDYHDRRYEDHKRRCEQKTSRSFDSRRERFEEEPFRRTARSDPKDKRHDYNYNYYEHLPTKERSRRNVERCDRNSVVSRDDDRDRDRDRYSERERDSGLSVADGEASTVSGRSNYLRVVKQEITEQREAMDKMMNLWKELMRCFKGVSQTQDKEKTMNECGESVRESAAAQLRLWRECMRRYETVARDVGDTDARLMEEINKQRSEMAEMATMWQECLQRYRTMSDDFNTLKQKLSTPESPQRPVAPPPAPAPVCAEGEGPAPAPHYRMPPTYPQMGPPCSGGYGTALRGRASAPPAWWWAAEHAGGAGGSPRRRSSPDSRGSRDRDRRHRHEDARDKSRYKEKSSKPSAARSEHRHRKR